MRLAQFFLLGCFPNLLFCTQPKPFIYAAVDNLRVLFVFERDLVRFINNQRKQLIKPNIYIDQYMNEFELIQKQHPDELVKDPIHGYQLLRRLTFTLRRIEKTSPEIRLLPVPYDLKSKRDVIGAAKGLAALQAFYKLNVEEFANGKIGNFQSSASLTGEDCYIISEAVNVSTYEGNRDEWIAAAKRRFDKGIPHEIETTMNTIRAIIQRSEAKMSLMENKGKNKIVENPKVKLWYKGDFGEMDVSNYYKLCQGQKLLRPVHESRLKCRLSTLGHACYILKPIKLEQYSLRPPIWVFHDVINHYDIHVFQVMARVTMRRSKVKCPLSKGPLIIDDSARLTKHCLITDERQFIAKLSARVGNLLGFTCQQALKDCDAFEVSNFGFAGEYYPHWDAAEDKTREHKLLDVTFPGNRMATFMFFMSDVEQGGNVVFPRAGVTVKPTKGSALFWYNLFPNGTRDRRTLHGDCPVLYGNKWVATKWILEKSQMFRRPCGKDQLTDYVPERFKG